MDLIILGFIVLFLLLEILIYFVVYRSDEIKKVEEEERLESWNRHNVISLESFKNCKDFEKCKGFHNHEILKNQEEDLEAFEAFEESNLNYEILLKDIKSRESINQYNRAESEKATELRIGREEISMIITPAYLTYSKDNGFKEE